MEVKRSVTAHGVEWFSIGEGVPFIFFHGMYGWPGYDAVSKDFAVPVQLIDKAKQTYQTNPSFPVESGFKFIFGIFPTNQREYNLADVENFLTDIGYKNDGVIAGHSRGGTACQWFLKSKFTCQLLMIFATAVESEIKSYSKVDYPIWIIHSEKDSTGGTNVKNSQDLRDKLEAVGNKVIYTEWFGLNFHAIQKKYFYGSIAAVQGFYEKVRSYLKPVAPSLPKPVGDIYQENGKFWISLSDGRKAEVIF